MGTMKTPIDFRQGFEIEEQGCALLAHINTLVYNNMVRNASEQFVGPFLKTFLLLGLHA